MDLDCSEFSDIVKTIIYNESNNELELTFTNSLENRKIITPFNPFKIERSLRDLEKKLTNEIPSIGHEFIRIENSIINNLDKLIAHTDNREEENKRRQKINL